MTDNLKKIVISASSIKKVFLLAFLTVCFFLNESSAADNILKGSVVVKFTKDAPPVIKKDILSKSGAAGSYSAGVNRAVSVNVPSGKTVSDMVKYFLKQKDVEYAEPVYILKTFKLPGDYENSAELKKRQWGLSKIEMPAAWDVETGTEVVVAIVDTGIDLDHPELSANIWNNPNASTSWGTYQSTTEITYTVVNDTNGWDFVNHDNDPDDDKDHGTHCAGIVAASPVDVFTDGIVGVSWYNKLMAVKVMNDKGRGTSVDVANGIIYAAQRGADVISMSLGGGVRSQLIEDAVNRARNEGAFLVAATGNDYNDEIAYPAGYLEVFSVGASSNTDIRADFSNYGEGLDVVAPGTDIYSTIMDGYAEHDGTSMACPYVAGLASLIISQWDIRMNSPWTPRAVGNAIISNTDDINSSVFPGWDKYTGYGRINAKKTLEYVDITEQVVAVEKKEAIAYPNPFNPDNSKAVIALPENFSGSAKTMAIYNLQGKRVKQTGASGNNAVWDGLNDENNKCASGLYFFAIRATNDKIFRGKITLLR